MGGNKHTYIHGGECIYSSQAIRPKSARFACSRIQMFEYVQNDTFRQPGTSSTHIVVQYGSLTHPSFKQQFQNIWKVSKQPSQ